MIFERLCPYKNRLVAKAISYIFKVRSFFLNSQKKTANYFQTICISYKIVVTLPLHSSLRMKPKEIQDLLEYIAKSGMAEVNIETEGLKLHVKRANFATEAIAMPIATPMIATSVVHQAPIAASVQTEKVEAPATTQTTVKDSGNYITIKSPMIGTFYRSANPETPAFANVGDDIKAGKIVCIIEAMKLFNEIESEVSGRIVKVLVENASPVEYDQPLFLVEPA